MSSQGPPGWRTLPRMSRSPRPLVALAACVATVSLAAACGTAPAPTGASPADVVRAGDDVVREGSRVRGTGRVVSVPGQPVRLCANAFSADVGYAEGQEPPPRGCEHGVDVTGVNLALLEGRREKEGAVQGRATLTGTWRDGMLEVEQQEPPRPPPEIPGARIITTPGSSYNYRPSQSPCPLPAGGLPPTDWSDNLSVASPQLEEFFAAHPDARPFSSLRRPQPDQVVFALGVQDDAERADAERLLRPVLGERLCVVDASVTPAQVEAAQADPAFQVGPGPDRPFGKGLGMADGATLMPQVSVDVVMVTDQLRQAADAYPEGLVQLNPAITVVAG